MHLKIFFCLYISQFVSNLWQLYIVDISMDILAKLNDFDALKNLKVICHLVHLKNTLKSIS